MVGKFKGGRISAMNNSSIGGEFILYERTQIRQTKSAMPDRGLGGSFGNCQALTRITKPQQLSFQTGSE
jgi:hypothetical protein